MKNGEWEMKKNSPVSKFFSLGAILLYLAFAAHQLGLPGLYYDEALDLPQAVQLAHGWPVTLFPKDPGVNVLGYTLPVMVIDYVGAVNTYLMTALFAFTGGHWVAVRWFQVAVGALIVALSFRLARHWFGPLVAVIATLLLAVNPSFIFWSRMGISVTHVMALCSLGSLVLFTHHPSASSGQAVSRFTPSARFLFFAGLLLGLGVWAKFLFVWWIAALGGVYVVFCHAHWRRGPWRDWLAVGAGALIGAAPLLYYNLKTSETLTLLLNSLNSPTPNGVNNQNFLANFQARLEQFRIWLDGSYFWYNGGLHANEWVLMIYGVALVIVLFVVAGLGRKGEVFGKMARKPLELSLSNTSPLPQYQLALILIVILAIILVLSSFTVSGIWATHLFILFPIPQIGVALAAVWLLGKRIGVLALILPLAIFVLDARVTLDYHADLARTGGPGRFSSAIYAFANYLDENKLHTPAALDWGLEKNTFVLTDGRVQPIEIFGYSPEPDEGFRERILASLCDGCAFINVDAAYAVYPRESAFRQIVAEVGYRVADEETMIFRERSGQPAFYIYRVRSQP